MLLIINKTMKEFWLDSPSQLFTNLSFIPTSNMTLDEKYNALTRLVIIVAIIMYLTKQTHAITLLVVGIVAVIILRNSQVQSTNSKDSFTPPPYPFPAPDGLQRPPVRYRIGADVHPLEDLQTGITAFGYEPDAIENGQIYEQPKLAFDPAASYRNVLRDYVSNRNNYTLAEREIYENRDTSRNTFQQESEEYYRNKKPRTKVYAT